MHKYEQMNKQLNDYYLFASSILNFLQKHLTQFHKALINYSIVLKHLHRKSINLLTKTNSNQELIRHLHYAFLSLTQTFHDEYHQLEQRAKFLKIIQLTIQNLKQQISSSNIIRQKHKLHKYTYRIINLNQHKKQDYLYKLVQQIGKHDKLTITWKNNLDNITSQTINLLWKLFCYSPCKFHMIPIQTTPSNFLSINEISVNFPYTKNNKQNDELFSPIELGSGDQLHSETNKENISHEFDKEQEQEYQISNSNNALMESKSIKQHNVENQSFYSTDIDETIVEKNQFYNNIIDDNDDEDDDIRWINLVKQNEIESQQTITLSTSTDQSSDNSENIVKQDKKLIKRINSLHLSDISYTTDYYLQDESN